ncbi:VanZ family protein [Lysobacter korlensis]|uniref:VanZ family protein n=1 Tax=Lysobacter korlensis TaxID=553636 RepID=A0ABV6RR76_9GAMM
MPGLRTFRYPWLWLAGWLLLIAVVVAGSLLPAQQLPEPAFAGVDKLQHFVGYAALSGYAVMLFERVRAQAAAACAMLLLGALLEFVQGAMTDSRLADAVDVIANSLGVAAGWALRYTRLRRLLQLIEGCVVR